MKTLDPITRELFYPQFVTASSEEIRHAQELLREIERHYLGDGAAHAATAEASRSTGR